MKFLSFALILLFSIVAQNEPIDTRKGKDLALFFAVEDYQDPSWRDLKNPIGDVEAIAKELEEMYEVKTHIIRNPTKKQILETLIQWQKHRFAQDGQLLVFFSGHGAFSESASQGYFIPKDGKFEDPFHESHIELSSLGNYVTKIPCPHILLALDACYSGTIDREIAFKGDNDSVYSRPRATDFDERLATIARQLQNPTRLLLTSGGKERTPDGAKHSPFSAAFLKSLRQSYVQGDGIVLFSDILARMERVKPVPHSGELPGHEDGGFVFLESSLSSKPKYSKSPVASWIVSNSWPKEEERNFSVELNGKEIGILDTSHNVINFKITEGDHTYRITDTQRPFTYLKGSFKVTPGEDLHLNVSPESFSQLEFILEWPSAPTLLIYINDSIGGGVFPKYPIHRIYLPKGNYKYSIKDLTNKINISEEIYIKEKERKQITISDQNFGYVMFYTTRRMRGKFQEMDPYVAFYKGTYNSLGEINNNTDLETMSDGESKALKPIKSYEIAELACGNPRGITFDLPDGAYTYYATFDGRDHVGNFHVRSNQCTLVRLK